MMQNDEVAGTCEGVPHVEGVSQQQCARGVDGRGRHELILHAADAAGPHSFQEGLSQLLRHLFRQHATSAHMACQMMLHNTGCGRPSWLPRRVPAAAAAPVQATCHVSATLSSLSLPQHAKAAQRNDCMVFSIRRGIAHSAR